MKVLEYYIGELWKNISKIKNKVHNNKFNYNSIDLELFSFEYSNTNYKGFVFLRDEDIVGGLVYNEIDSDTYLLTNVVSKDIEIKEKLIQVFAEYLTKYVKDNNNTVRVTSPDTMSDRIFEEKGFNKDKLTLRQILREEREYIINPSSQR